MSAGLASGAQTEVDHTTKLPGNRIQFVAAELVLSAQLRDITDSCSHACIVERVRYPERAYP